MGILANSASVTHTSSTTDDTKAGFIINEQVTLTCSVAGTVFAWSIAKPSGASSRSDLTVDDEASPKFTPDVAGTYAITLTEDGTTYVLRVTATAVAITSVANAHRFSPTTDTSIPTPALGKTVYCSSDASNEMRMKNTSGTVLPLNIMPTYTVSTVPSASTWVRGMIYVSNETGGAVPAFSDGTNWRRVTDRAIVS